MITLLSKSCGGILTQWDKLLFGSKCRIFEACMPVYKDTLKIWRLFISSTCAFRPKYLKELL